MWMAPPFKLRSTCRTTLNLLAVDPAIYKYSTVLYSSYSPRQKAPFLSVDDRFLDFSLAAVLLYSFMASRLGEVFGEGNQRPDGCYHRQGACVGLVAWCYGVLRASLPPGTLAAAGLVFDWCIKGPFCFRLASVRCNHSQKTYGMIIQRQETKKSRLEQSIQMQGNACGSTDYYRHAAFALCNLPLTTGHRTKRSEPALGCNSESRSGCCDVNKPLAVL